MRGKFFCFPLFQCEKLDCIGQTTDSKQSQTQLEARTNRKKFMRFTV